MGKSNLQLAEEALARKTAGKSNLQLAEEVLARKTAQAEPPSLWSQAKEVGKETLRQGVPILGGAAAGMAAFPISGPLGSALAGATAYGALKKGVNVADRGFKPMPVEDEMKESADLLTEGAVSEVIPTAIISGVKGGYGAAKELGSRIKAVDEAFKKEGTSLRDILDSDTGRAKLHETVPKMLRGKVEKLRPTEDYNELFDIAEKAGGNIPTTRTLETILKNRAEVEALSEGAQAGNALSTSYGRGLEKKIAPGYITPKDMQGELRYLGSKIGKEGLDAGLRKQTIKGMFEDLDAAGAAGTPGAAELVKARKTFKRDKAVDTLMGAIDDANMVLQGQGGDSRFAANKIINQIKGGKGGFRYFDDAFAPAESAEIMGLLEAYNKLPALHPPPGANYGSGGVIKTLLSGGGIGGGAGGAIGAGFGGVLGAGVGAPLGAAIGGALSSKVGTIMTNFKAAMSIPEGRKAMSKVLKEKGTIGLQEILATAGTRAATGANE